MMPPPAPLLSLARPGELAPSLPSAGPFYPSGPFASVPLTRQSGARAPTRASPTPALAFPSESPAPAPEEGTRQGDGSFTGNPVFILVALVLGCVFASVLVAVPFVAVHGRLRRARGSEPEPRISLPPPAAFEIVGRDPPTLLREIASRVRDSREVPPDADCSICLDTLRGGGHVCRLRCDHVFHESCVKEWIAQGSDSLCPVCRLSMRDEFYRQWIISITRGRPD